MTVTDIVALVSDIQAPYQDKRAVAAVATWLADIMPSRVACVGDVLDGPQISQWTKGRAGEFAGNLASDRDNAVQALRDLRVTDLSRSNHDDRLAKYVANHAPGLAGLPELSIEQFMQLDELGIAFHAKPFKVAPGWMMMHGDECGGSRISGGTAMGLARKIGYSVVCGNTHKVGLLHDHSSVSGRITRELFGFEVGNLMEQKRASYLGAGYANWQQSVGALVIDGKDVHPIPVLIRQGRLMWEGKTYRG
jgi:hypothetical protein